MIQVEVQEVGEVFRSQLAWMLGAYPALVPHLTWPSAGVLEALCRRFRGRSDWNEDERLFVIGASAHLGEFVHQCWERFADHVHVGYSDGVVCTGRMESRDEHLPLEAKFVTMLRSPEPALTRPGALALSSSDERPIETFALAACLGMDPVGQGTFGGLKPEELDARVEAVLPLLAESCAAHYAERYPDEPFGRDPELYRRGLIWPLPPPNARHPYLAAATAILDFIERYCLLPDQALRLLTNLARSPSQTIRGGSLVCLSLDESVTISGEIAEIAVHFFRGRAGRHRRTVLELARRSGRRIDWLEDGPDAQSRFRFERRMGLMPLLTLPFAEARDPVNRQLVEALLEMRAEAASLALELQLRATHRRPTLVLQHAVLKRETGDPEAAESILSRLAEEHGGALDDESYLEWGRCALAIGDAEAARSRLELARRSQTTRLRAASSLAEVYASTGRPKEAVELFSEAVVRGYRPCQALVGRARTHRLVGSHDLFYRDLGAAAALDPFRDEVVDEVMTSYLEM